VLDFFMTVGACRCLGCPLGWRAGEESDCRVVQWCCRGLYWKWVYCRTKQAAARVLRFIRERRLEFGSRSELEGVEEEDRKARGITVLGG
jgi:hypothetical protein